jgi:hypothetical protein
VRSDEGPSEVSQCRVWRRRCNDGQDAPPLLPISTIPITSARTGQLLNAITVICPHTENASRASRALRSGCRLLPDPAAAPALLGPSILSAIVPSRRRAIGTNPPASRGCRPQDRAHCLVRALDAQTTTAPNRDAVLSLGRDKSGARNGSSWASAKRCPLCLRAVGTH